MYSCAKSRLLPTWEEVCKLSDPPRLHPNGFLQLDLNTEKTKRLHIWHPGLGRQKVATTTHDHRFDMSSAVHQGVLAQVRYPVVMEHAGAPTDEIFMARHTKGEHTTLEGTGVFVRRQRPDIALVKGLGEYSQPAFTFHDSVPVTPIVVTVMEKTKEYVNDQPRVLVPLGLDPDNEFDREDVDESKLWDILERVLS